MPPHLTDESTSRRRPRHRLSCGECRRLKLKCDRVWPCSSCTKRGCARICPDGVMQSRIRSKDTSVLLSKIAELENALREKDKAITAVIQGDLSASDLQRQVQASGQASENTDFMPSISGMFSGDSWTADGHDETNKQDIAMSSLLDGIGTLNVGGDGRSRFLGLSAGSAYLDNDSDADSRASTPGTSEVSVSDVSGLGFLGRARMAKFPTAFCRPAPDITKLKSYLPPKQEAARLGNIYYSLVSYMYEPFERHDYMQLLDEAYGDPRDEVCPTRLALLYTFFALGVLFDPALPAVHSDCAKWQDVAETCLMSTDYLTSPTLAAVQTLLLMSTLIFNSRTDAEEIFWPVLGIAMRLAQSMGLHRDGSNWGLEQPDLDNRRRTFHELLSMDRLQALALGRPYSIVDKHFDTATPVGAELGQEVSAQRCATGDGNDEDEVRAAGFHVFKWRFSATIASIVDGAFSVMPPSYSMIMTLDSEIRLFDQSLPDSLRCAAIPSLAPVSIYSRHQANSPPRATPNLKLTLQQHTLAVFTNQTLLFLHRRAFVQALTESNEPMQTPYSSSVVTVILEAGKNLIAIAKSAQEIYELSNRWWHLFEHAYGGATCHATLLIKSPGSMLVQNSWEQLQMAVSVFETAAQHGPKAKDLLGRLLKLQEKAVASVQAYQAGTTLPRFRRPSPASGVRNLRPLSRIRGRDHDEGSTPMASGAADPYRSSSSDGDDIPPELGATTRLTRRTRRRQHSISGSSVASSSHRGPSVSSSRSRGASFGGSSSSASERGGSSYRNSWAGAPSDEFEDPDAPPPWPDVVIEPRESFGSPAFGKGGGAGTNHHGNYFQGFSESCHPPMVLPTAQNAPRGPTGGLPPKNNVPGYTAFAPGQTPFDSPRLHPLPPSVTGSPPLGPVLSGGPALSLSLTRSGSGTRGPTQDANEGLQSPANPQFDLLDTFLTWQAYDQPYDGSFGASAMSDGQGYDRTHQL